MRIWRNIQGLRALAVLLVVGAHEHDFLDRFHIHTPLQTLTAIEAWGVDLFFVISGFVMISAHWQDFGTAGAPARFLLRRALRIFPMYWLITLFLFGLFALEPGLLHNWVGGHANVAASLLLLVPRGHYPLLWVGWTLVFEMYFYYVFAATLTVSRRLALTLIGGWSVCIVLLQFLPRTDNLWYRTLSDGLVVEFSLGLLVGTLVAKKVFLRTRPSIAMVFGACVALAFVFRALYNPAEEQNAEPPLRFLTVGLPMAFILYGAVSLEARKKLVMPAPLLFLGDASYSIYLTHAVFYVALGRILRSAAPGGVPLLVSTVVVPLSVIVGGCVAYVYLERPLTGLSRSLVERWFPHTLARPLRVEPARAFRAPVPALRTSLLDLENAGGRQGRPGA